MGKKFNIIVFTSSSEAYAEVVTSKIDKFNIIGKIYSRNVYYSPIL